MGETVVEAFLSAAKTHPDFPVLRWLDERCEVVETRTYANLLQTARQTAETLIANGAQPGDRAVLCHSPGLEFISAFFGCLLARVIAVPVSPPSPAKMEYGMKKLTALMNDCTCKFFLTCREGKKMTTAEVFRSAVSHMNVHVLSSDDFEQNKVVRQDGTHGEDPPSPDTDVVAFLQYTSGSTGLPKGVVITHGNLMHNLCHVKKARNSGPFGSEVEVSWLPHFHDMGLTLSYLFTIVYGAQGYFMSPQAFVRAPSLWLRALSTYRGTLTSGPNFAFELVMKRGLIDDINLSSLKQILTGAEPIHIETIEKFQQALAPFGLADNVFVAGYGQAEHVVIISASTPNQEPVVKQGLISCGPPLDGISMKIVDPNTMKELPEGDVGEIWVTSSGRVQGYWGKEDLSEKTFQAETIPSDGEGYLRTGDLGYMNDGEVFIAGRLKDIIIVHGRNIYPNDIEFFLEGMFGSLRPGSTVAYPIESEATKEELIGIVAEVLLEEGMNKEELHKLATDMAQSVVMHFEAEVSSVALTKIKTVPKTSSGKVQRKQTKANLQEGTIIPLYNWDISSLQTSQQPKARSITSLTQPSMVDVGVVLSEVLGMQLEEDTDFWALGCTSLKAAEISQTMKEKYQVEMAIHSLYACKTVSDVYHQLVASDSLAPTPVVESAPSVQRTDEGIAIIGMACRFPQADTPEEFWKMLMAGMDASTVVSMHDLQGTTIRGCFTKAVDVFDYRWFGMSEEKASQLDPQHSMLLHTVNDTLINAGYDTTTPIKSNMGVFIGMSGKKGGNEGGEQGDFNSEATLPAMAASMISYHFGLTGPSIAVDVACASSLTALHLARSAILLGECESAVVAGVNALLTAEGFHVSGLSTDEKCKLFDKNGTGYVRGEGCGAVLLKPVSKAQKDGDRILAVIRGSVCNHSGSTAPMFKMASPSSQVSLLELALSAAGLQPDNVAFIEAHASGKAIADVMEAESIATVYKDTMRRKEMYVSSVKGNIGHLEEGAGVASLIKAVLSLQHSVLPPTINVESPHPMLPSSITIPTGQARILEHNEQCPPNMLAAGVTAFSLGGASAHVLLQQGSMLPSMARVAVGVIVSLETENLPSVQAYENIFKDLTMLPGFGCGVSEVYSEAVKLCGIEMQRVDTFPPVLMEFTLIHCILQSLNAVGTEFTFFAATCPVSELLASVHAGYLSLRDALAILLAKMMPDMRNKAFSDTLTPLLPKCLLYSPSNGHLLEAGKPSTTYLPMLIKDVWEQSSLRVAVEDIFMATAHLKAHTIVSMGSGTPHDSEDGIHAFGCNNMSSLHKFKQALMELRSDFDLQARLIRRKPSETTLLPQVYSRFPLRSAIAGHTKDPFSPDYPPCPRRRSSSIYGDLAIHVLSYSSSESSNNSITEATINMNSVERLMLAVEIVCLSAQEMLDFDLVNKSISEHEDLEEMGLEGDRVDELIQKLKNRTGVELNLQSLRGKSATDLAKMIVTQLYPGVAVRDDVQPTTPDMTEAVDVKEVIVTALYNKVKTKYPTLPPIEMARSCNVYGLGIKSDFLTELTMYVREKYHYVLSFGRLHQLGTLELIAETVAQDMEQRRQSIYPVLTKPGYCTDPPMQKILQASPQDLQKIHNFTITNTDVGQIRFLGYSDLTGIDLNSTVLIDAGEVTVYPPTMDLPPLGNGLNKPALITFYNIHPRKLTPEGYERMERRLKKNCEEKGLCFIAYDQVSGDFVFKVAGF